MQDDRARRRYPSHFRPRPCRIHIFLRSEQLRYDAIEFCAEIRNFVIAKNGARQIVSVAFESLSCTFRHV